MRGHRRDGSLRTVTMAPRPVERVVRDPRFERLVPADAELVWHAGGGLWAEGPVYVPAEDALIWSDVRRNVVHRWSAADGVTDLYRPSDFANGHTLDHDGRVLACEHGLRRVARYEADGSRTTIVDRYQGRRLNSPNDIIVASDGAIWFTDPPYGILDDREGYKADSELGGCFVFRLDRTTGELTVATDALVHPNGLALSLDERTLYVSDTGMVEGRHHIMAFDVVDGSRLERTARLPRHGARRLGRLPARCRRQHLDVGRRRDPRPRLGRGRARPDRPPGGGQQLHLRRRRRPAAVHHRHVDAVVDRGRDPRRSDALGG